MLELAVDDPRLDARACPFCNWIDAVNDGHRADGLTRIVLLARAKWRETDGLRSWLLQEGARTLLARLPSDSQCSVGIIEQCLWNTSGRGGLPYDAMVEVLTTRAVAAAAFTCLRPHTRMLHFSRVSAFGFRGTDSAGLRLLAIWNSPPGAEPEQLSSRVRQHLQNTLPPGHSMGKYVYGRLSPLLSTGSSPLTEMAILELRGPSPPTSDLTEAGEKVERCVGEPAGFMGNLQLLTVGAARYR